MLSTHAFVIEEEALVALDIESILAQHGVTEFRHYRSVSEAAPHLQSLVTFGLAIVEARLGAADVVDFTRRLVEAGVGTVVMSADHSSAGFFPHAVPLAKPFDTASLIAACEIAAAS